SIGTPFSQVRSDRPHRVTSVGALSFVHWSVEVKGKFELPPAQGAGLPPRSAVGAGTAADLRGRSHLRCVLSPVSVGLGLPPPVRARPAAYAPRTARPVPAVVCPPLMRGNGLLHHWPSPP